MVSATIFSVVPAIATEEEVHPFIYATGSSPEGIDPLGVYDTSSGLIITNVLETLFAFDYSDPSMPSVPLLAASEGTFNTDKTEWTIPLRQDVTWQDGTPFTAEDVLWNFDRLNTLSLNGTCEHYSLWFNDEGDLILNRTEKIDDYTIKFVLNKAWLDFQALLPFWGCALIKPVDGFEEKIIEMDNIDLLIGTGPFELESVVIGEKSVLTQYADYWGGPADFQQVILQVFDSATTWDQALFNQEVHMVRSITTEDIPTADADPNVNYQNVKSACCYFFHLGVNSIPWHARKAIQYSFNYTYLIHTLLEDAYYEIHTPVPDGMFGHNPNIPGLPYFDLAKARSFLLADDSPYKAKLDDAGITASSSDDDWIALAETDPIDTFNFTRYWGSLFLTLLQDFNKYVGIEIKDNNQGDWPTFLNYCNNNPNLGIVMGGWCPDYFAAVNQIEPLFGGGASSNWNRLDNATINANLGALHTIPQGPELQTAIDEVVQQIIVEQAAGMYFMQSAENIAWSSFALDESTLGDIFNAQLDKYFYNILWNSKNIPESWWGNPEAHKEPGATETGGFQIPGYSVGIFMALSIGAAAFLLLRKRK